MRFNTTRPIRLSPDGITLTHASIAWFALALALSLAARALPEGGPSALLIGCWTLLSFVTLIVGPMQCAAALAADRHSDLFAFERQRAGRSIAALAKVYALDAQRFVVSAPLVTAPMFWWATKERGAPETRWYPLIVVAAQLVATILAIAVAASRDRRAPPGSTTGLSVVAVGAGVGGAALLWLGLASTTWAVALLALVAVSTIAIAAGAARKLTDDEAAFFSPAVAVTTQVAVMASLLTALIGSRAAGDGPRALRAAFAFAWIIAALARSRAMDGAQDLLRWSLDEHRRALDPRDPRRSLALSLALSAICASALVFAPAIDAPTVGTFVLGSAILVVSSALSVVDRAQRAWWTLPVRIGAIGALAGWTAAATAADDGSALFLSCPTLLTDDRAVSATAFALRACVATVIALVAARWSLRSFARATSAMRDRSSTR